jgi:hypothetical protein
MHYEDEINFIVFTQLDSKGFVLQLMYNKLK